MTGNNLKTISTDIKSSNASLILRIVRENAPISRADLSRATGLTRSTVSSLIASLIELGYLEEIGLNTPGSVGKRATLLDIRTNKLFVLAVKFSFDNILMAKVDLKGDLHLESKKPLAIASREEALETLRSMVRSYLEQSRKKGEICNGIGIAVPSPLKNGVMAHAASFHCLEGVDLAAILREEFDLPVSVNNDADAAALAEVWYGGYPQGTNVAFVLVQQGIGCGMMRDKELYFTGLQTSNEFGHIRIESGGPVCFCGKTGCLVTFASDWSIFERLPEELREVMKSEAKSDESSNLEAMMKHIKANPREYSKYVFYAAKYMGIGIANLVSMFTPDVVVIEGELIGIPGFLEKVEEVCEQNVHPMFNCSYRICRSHLKQDPSLTGAGTFLVREIYMNPFNDRHNDD